MKKEGILNILLDSGNIEEFEKHLPLEISCSNAILLSRYYVLKNDEESLIELLDSTKDIFRKRQLQIVIAYLISVKKEEKAFLLFERYISKFEIEGQDIEPFLETEFAKIILEKYINEPILFKNLKSNTNDTSLLKIIPFSEKENEKIINILKKRNLIEIPEFDEKFDFIIDGANVLYSVSKTISEKSYKKLLYVIEKCTNPCLVIHEKYLKNEFIKSEIAKRGIKYIKTPYGRNDDLYILMVALKYNTRIITNDQFRDHIFKFQERFFKSWLDDTLVPYSSVSPFSLQIPTFSKRIQKVNENSFYLYTTSGWYIINFS